MKKLKLKKSVLNKLVVFSIFIALTGFVWSKFIPDMEVKAAANTIDVAPGANTLKNAVTSAHDGDTLRLKAGSYTGGGNKVVVIDKGLTIIGENNKTVIDVPLEIKTENPVKIANIASSPIQPENGFVYIKTFGKVNLEIDNAFYYGILRSDNGFYPDLDTTIVSVNEGDNNTTESDRSVINIKNSRFIKAGIRYCISMNTSNTTINIDNSEMDSRSTIYLDQGKGNIINIDNNSKVAGPSYQYRETEAITIKNQENLKINVNNSTLTTHRPINGQPVKLFSFSEAGKSTNVSIDIKNTKIEDSSNNANTKIFNFRSDATATDNNVITIDNNTTFTNGNTNLGLSQKYNQVSNAAIIGVYDSLGNSTVKVYDNDTEIKELTDEDYIVKAGYKFKGWFKNIDYTEEYSKQGSTYPKAVKANNMDLFPKFAKVLKLTVNNNTYNIEEGQTIKESENSADIINDLAAIKQKDGQTFKGFIIYNSNGDKTYETGEEEKLINELRMTQDCRIEAIHKVVVKVNDVPFEIDAGQTLEDIEDQAALEEAKMKNANGRSFSRFVRKGTDTTVTEKDGIAYETELVSKYFYNVTINEVTYQLEEGKKLNSNEEIKNALEIIAPEIAGRTFNRYIDTATKKKIDVDTYKIDKDIDISAVYTVKVKLIGKTKTYEYEIDADTSLESSSTDNDTIIAALEDVAANVEDEHNFDGFVLSYDNTDTNIIFDKSGSTTKEDLEQQILKQTIENNTTIYIRYNIIVTINGEPFELETGQSIQTGILDTMKTDLINRYNTAKYGTKGEERFYKFVDADGKEVKEQDAFEKKTNLTSKYVVFVTIDDEREEIGGTYKVEEGKSIEDLIGDEANNALAALRTNIVNEDITKENLHFEKLVTSTNEEVPSKINEDITIKGVYHYDVSVVEDYDNPTYGSDDSHGISGLKVLKDRTLKDIETEINNALKALNTSVNNSKRKLYSYIEKNTNTEFTDVNTILDKAFNTHLYITAKVAYKVEIGDIEDYVLEGKTLKESENHLLVDALNNLKSVDGKQLDKIYINGKEVNASEVNEDTVINEYTKITAKYNVNVSINGKTFTVEEGKSLSTLTQQQTEIQNALDALKAEVKSNNYNFVEFVDDEGNKFDINTEVNKNTTISAKYNIKVIINKEKFTLEVNDTLKDIADKAKYKDVTTKTDREFAHKFYNEKGEVITEDTKLTQNEVLTPIFNVTVTVGKDKYQLQENAPLSDNNDIIKALEIFNVPNKIVSGYVDNNGNEITKDSKINDNITIKPVYSVKLTIKYLDEVVGEFTFKENLSVNEAPNKQEIIDAFDTLTQKVKDAGYNFKGYTYNDKEFTFDTKVEENITVIAKYNIEITINNEKFEINSGETLKEVKAFNENLYETVTTKTDREFLYFEDTNGNIINEDYKFDRNTTLVPVFAVKVTIDKKDYLLKENEPLSSNEKIVEALKKLDNSKEKRVSAYKDANDNIIATVEEITAKTDKIITDNIVITPLYVIDVEIFGGTNFKKEVAEGTLLKDVGYEKPHDFERFVDYETGEEVEENTKLTKHTKLKVIFNVEVKVNGNIYRLESFKTFGDLTGNDVKADLEELKKVPENKKSFSRYYYIDSDTKEEVTLNKDTVISKDIEVLPKYNIELTFVYENENSEEEIIRLELEEDKSISELEKLSLLNEKLQEIEEKLEEQGLHSYKFSKFLQEDGTLIDIAKTKFTENATIKAIFEYKQTSTPIEPEPSKPEDNNDNNDKNDNEVVAPNTGIKSSNSDVSNLILSIAIILLTTTGCYSSIKYLIKK